MLPQELRPEEQQGSSQTRTWDRSGADAGAKALRLEDAQAPEDCEGRGDIRGARGRVWGRASGRGLGEHSVWGRRRGAGVCGVQAGSWRGLGFTPNAVGSCRWVSST